MDSDDDFMSDVSSQDDFLDMQGSDDESLGEGTYLTETWSEEHSPLDLRGDPIPLECQVIN